MNIWIGEKRAKRYSKQSGSLPSHSQLYFILESVVYCKPDQTVGPRNGKKLYSFILDVAQMVIHKKYIWRDNINKDELY